jgi:hypothetical protein
MAVEKKKIGRPSKYDPEKHPKLTYEFCSENGFTDEKLAKAFQVNVETITRWAREKPEFSRARKEGKDAFDTGMVEKSLLRRAQGFDVEEKIYDVIDGKPIEMKRIKKVVPPDATSLIFWLKNRNAARWRDKKDFEMTNLGDMAGRLTEALQRREEYVESKDNG